MVVMILLALFYHYCLFYLRNWDADILAEIWEIQGDRATWPYSPTKSCAVLCTKKPKGCQWTLDSTWIKRKKEAGERAEGWDFLYIPPPSRLLPFPRVILSSVSSSLLFLSYGLNCATFLSPNFFPPSSKRSLTSFAELQGVAWNITLSVVLGW